MGILKEETKYDELADKIVVNTIYDNTDVLALNAAQRAEKIDGQQFKGNGLVHVGRIDMGDVVRLKNLGYDLLSGDPEEVRRALLYVQSNEPYMLTVNKKPFTKRRVKWA